MGRIGQTPWNKGLKGTPGGRYPKGHNRQVITCGACKVEVEAYGCEGRKYCSRDCANIGKQVTMKGMNRGDNNGQWKGLTDKPCKQCGVLFSVRPARLVAKYCSRSCAAIATFAGPANPNWAGGVTNKNKLIRRSSEYQEWRKKIFERDGYKCVLCGDNKYLNADHIKPFAIYKELRFNIENGRTLCVPCHRATETYGSGTRKIMREMAAK